MIYNCCLFVCVQGARRVTIKDGTLHISSSIPDDLGLYRCDASNSVGPTASAQAYLNVTCEWDYDIVSVNA